MRRYEVRRVYAAGGEDQGPMYGNSMLDVLRQVMIEMKADMALTDITPMGDLESVSIKRADA